MKKSTKVTVFSLIVIGIMFVSVVSYAFLNIFTENKPQASEITSYIMKENISEEVKYAYISRGLTFLEVHYHEGTQHLLPEIEGLPSQLTTNTGAIQLIVIEIYDAEKSYAIAEGINGYKEMNITDANEMARTLCDILYFTPIECISFSESGATTTVESTESNTSQEDFLEE